MAGIQEDQPAPQPLTRTRWLLHWTASNRPAATTILGFTNLLFQAGIGVTASDQKGGDPMLPGVYWTVTGKPTQVQREMAVLYAGPRS
jgi:hypothetical protein